MRRRTVRAFGVAAALTWTALGLLSPAAWTRDGLVVCAFALVAAIALAPRAELLGRALLRPPRPAFDGACALAAAGISLWFLRVGLRDQPVTIDGGVYLFQARALAHGHFGMPVPSPSQAFANHFVFEGPDRRLYGVFPPGWPLAIVPFVWLGAPTLVGPAVAAILVVGQAALGRALGHAAGDDRGGELATRASLLLSLPPYARAVETGNLSSHAWLAALSAVALALALGLDPSSRPRWGRGALLGVCVGWAIASRLLDGLVLAGAVAGLLVWRRGGRRTLACASLGAVPWLALLAIEQRCATGSWLLPTQSAFFVRTDWPPGCHRLGFGRDVGCTVEHRFDVARFGSDGYDMREALRVVRERASTLGEDLFGFAPLVLLAFAPTALAASAGDAVCVAFVLALTLAYGLFYYGNSAPLGARHLFPAAPVLWLLAARGAVALAASGASRSRVTARAGAAALPLLVLASTAAARGPWSTRGHRTRERQAYRSGLRRTLEAHGIDRAILRSSDETAVAAAVDTWRDGSERLFVVDDGSGLIELRRAHPDLPVLLSLPGDDFGRLLVSPPPPGVLVELEREWPSFVRPSGLAASPAPQAGASGGSVLLLAHAQPGASVALPFEVASPGEYALRIDGTVGPDQGEYALELDGSPLARWQGYAPVQEPRRGESSRRPLPAGRHWLVARCEGKDAASAGYDARLDALVGEARDSPGPGVGPR